MKINPYDVIFFLMTALWFIVSTYLLDAGGDVILISGMYVGATICLVRIECGGKKNE